MNPKKLIRVFFLISLLVIAGCNSGDDGNGGGLWLMVVVKPASDNSIMQAYGFLHDVNTDTDLEADITVNGRSIKPSTLINIPELKEGDPVTIIANHPSIGTIENIINVPKTVKNVTCDGSLTDWRERTQKTLTLSWENGDADYYWVHVNGWGVTYDHWRSSGITIDKTTSDDLIAKIPESVSIMVQGAKCMIFNDSRLVAGSQFEVRGFKSEALTE